MSSLDSGCRRYLICCSPRTGSTLLSAGLRATGVAGAPAEPFDPRHVAERGRLDLPPEELIRITLDETASPNGFSGAKMMWTHFETMAALPRHGFPSSAELASLARRLPPMRYFWATRRDRVAQAVSFARALQTNRWVAGEPAPEIQPQFIWDEVNQYRKLLSRYDRLWEQYFAAAGLTPFKIVYEDFAANYESTMRSALDFLGLETAAVPTPVIERQADAVSQEWIRRYGQPTLADRGQTLVRRLHRGLGLTALRDYLLGGGSSASPAARHRRS